VRESITDNTVTELGLQTVQDLECRAQSMIWPPPKESYSIDILCVERVESFMKGFLACTKELFGLGGRFHLEEDGETI